VVHQKGGDAGAKSVVQSPKGQVTTKKRDLDNKLKSLKRDYL